MVCSTGQFLANVNSRSRSLYAVDRPPVVCLSVVCNARAPYSGGCNFRPFFYGIWYLGHSLTCTENFMKIVPGNPSVGRVKSKRVAQNIAILDVSKAISRKRCKIRVKLVLITNRKLHTGFRLVPNSVTLNDLERRSGHYFRYFSEIGSIRGALRKSG